MEGAIAGVLIALNEFALAQNKTAPVKDASPIYPRHRAMWEKSGIGFLGDKVIWWLVQLTKRDVAILFFLFLALAGRPAWILHLLGATAAISLGLALNAKASDEFVVANSCSARPSISGVSTSCHQASSISIARTLPSFAIRRTPSARPQSPFVCAFRSNRRGVRAKENARIDRVIFRKRLADPADVTVGRLNFHRVIEIENGLDLAVDREVQNCGI